MELDAIREKLKPYIEEHMSELPVEMCFFMLTNIVYEKTELLCFGERSKELAREAFKIHRKEN